MSVAERTFPLTIFSFEDEPKTIKGSLDSLEFEGHCIEQRGKLADARRCLEEYDIALILLDEHVEGLDDGGSTLIAELKRGDLGPRNMAVPFGFVTGSRAWVPEAEVAPLSGYMGIEVKGGDLTRRLRTWIETLAEQEQSSVALKLRRVPLCVEAVEGHGENASLRLAVPAWSPRETISYPLADLPEEMRSEPEQLAQQWFIARMNLNENDPGRIVIRDWEAQEPLDDDDGLA